MKTNAISTSIAERPESVRPAMDERRAGFSSPPRTAWWVWLVLTLGVSVRVWQYLLNRSIWLDEAYLALNLVHRSYAQLLQPLDYHQGAPLGFLMLEKSAVRLFAGNEYGLRAVPLLAGVASLFLFYFVAKRFVRATAVVKALALFAVSSPLVYYASEVKQYSLDVAVALILYLLAALPQPWQWKMGRICALGAAGAVAIWFSHPSVFVLAGIGATFSVILLQERAWQQMYRFAAIFLVWLASLSVFYVKFGKALGSDRTLLNYWSANFLPLPPRSVADLKWPLEAFFSFFANPVGMTFAGLAAVAFLLGAAHMYAADRRKLALLLSPALFTLLASALRAYPFGGRLTLFLVPAVLLLIAEGIEQARDLQFGGRAWASYLLFALLMLNPCLYLAHHLLQPRTLVMAPGISPPEEIKPVMAYLHAHEQPGDLVYLYSGAQAAYRYYDEIHGAREANLVLGSAYGTDARSYVSDLAPLRGHRVWVVFSHILGGGRDEANLIRFYCATQGRELDRFTAPGAAVYLYDLRPGASPAKSN